MELDNAALVAFAALAPILVAVIKQNSFAAKWNALIALGIYVVVGVAGAVVTGQTLSIETAVQFIATTVVVGTAAYQIFWRHWGDDAIQSATSIK